MTNSFGGIIVPLVTPFCGGMVDYSALKNIIDRCIDSGASGFVALGTTAETPTLSKKERDEILTFCIENARGAFVIAGTGSNSTKETVARTRRAESLGADGVLCVTPYYNKPPISGIIAHFCTVADATSLPVILYNVPSRTCVDLSPDAVKILKGMHNIIGIKEAGDSVTRVRELAALTDENFNLFCGNDNLTAEFFSYGASGTISAAANVMPEVFVKIFNLYKNSNAGKGEEIFSSVSEVVSALYLETNPVAIKYALSVLGLCENELRLPMCPLSHKNESILKNKLSKIYKELL